MLGIFEPIQFTDNAPTTNVCNPCPTLYSWLDSIPPASKPFNRTKKLCESGEFSAFGPPLNLRQESLDAILNTPFLDEETPSTEEELNVGDIVQLKQVRGPQYKYRGLNAVILSFLKKNKKRAIVEWQNCPTCAENITKHNVSSLRKSPTSVLDLL